MAQLKDTLISGDLRITDKTYVDTIMLPTSSGSNNQSAGENGQVLVSNGTASHWGIAGTAMRRVFIQGTQTTATTTGQWTGDASPYFNSADDLVDGQEITYWLPLPTTGNATLNLTFGDGTSSGAVNCYYGGTSRLTTHYGQGQAIHLTYRKNVKIPSTGSTTYTGWWADANYDSNSDTIDVLQGTYTIPVAGATAGLKQYSLFAQDADGKYSSFTTQNGTAVTKTVNRTDYFDISKIYYCSTGGNYATNDNIGTSIVRWAQALVDLRYTLNIATSALTARKPLYLIFDSTATTANAFGDTLYKLAGTSATDWWTQTLPTSADGKIYTEISRAVYDGYRGDLVVNHRYYTYTDKLHCYDSWNANVTRDTIFNAVSTGSNWSGSYSFVEGYGTNASGHYSHAGGFGSTASELNTFAFGNNALASSAGSIALGDSTTAKGDFAISIGRGNASSGVVSVALGEACTARNRASLAAGYSSRALSTAAIALGNSSTASGNSSIALGLRSIASANGAVAIGYQATASNNYSIALGYNVFTTIMNGQCIIGRYPGTATKKLFGVSLGTSAEGRSALVIDQGSSTSEMGNTSNGKETGNLRIAKRIAFFTTDIEIGDAEQTYSARNLSLRPYTWVPAESTASSYAMAIEDHNHATRGALDNYNTILTTEKITFSSTQATGGGVIIELPTTYYKAPSWASFQVESTRFATISNVQPNVADWSQGATECSITYQVGAGTSGTLTAYIGLHWD